MVSYLKGVQVFGQGEGRENMLLLPARTLLMSLRALVWKLEPFNVSSRIP